MASALVFSYGRRLAVSLMRGQGLLYLVPESTQAADVIAVLASTISVASLWTFGTAAR
jgi:hypothetical protein